MEHGGRSMEMKGKGGLFPFQLAWLIPTAAIVTVALGIWGWRSYNVHWDDAVYRSLALFEINNESYINPRAPPTGAFTTPAGPAPSR